MNVLLVSYAYKKNSKSEAHTAFLLAREIEKHHDVTIITRHSPQSNNTIQIPTPLLSRFHYPGAKIEYIEFNLRSFLRFRKASEEFDLMHHISPLSFRYPDMLCNLGRPFIWGPLGGSIGYPKGFEDKENAEKFGKTLRAVDRLRLKYDPLLCNTMKKSTFIVVTTNAAKAVLPERYHEKTLVIPEGISLDGLPRSDPKTVAEGGYIFASGRLVAYKAFDLLLQAYARVSHQGLPPLWITGDGPERSTLERQIEDLNLVGRVKLLGKVPKEANLDFMRQSLFCVFPALNEAFGHVYLEAMAVGKAVVATDWGGAADIVKDSVTGFKVLGNDVDGHVNALAEKIQLLATDIGLCRQMGDCGQKRVAKVFSWEAIGDRYRDLYERVARNDG